MHCIRRLAGIKRIQLSAWTGKPSETKTQADRGLRIHRTRCLRNLRSAELDMHTQASTMNSSTFQKQLTVNAVSHYKRKNISYEHAKRRHILCEGSQNLVKCDLLGTTEGIEAGARLLSL